MTLSDIKDLLRIVVESGVEEVEVEQDGTRVVVRRHAPSVTVQPAPPPYAFPYGPPAAYAPPPAYAPAPPAGLPTAPLAPPVPGAPPSAFADVTAEPTAVPTGQTVKAPIVGTFYRASSPETPPFAEVGQRVAKGDVLCIIEAMKLMNEIESEVAGTVRTVLVENAQPVEYDQPLFVIDPD